MQSEIFHGDCREIMHTRPVDVIVTDPPYGDTSLMWDRRVDGWLEKAIGTLNPAGSMWVFGSLRFFLNEADAFRAAGWRLAQEIVWEKHNGSGFMADRFKRVHELAVQFYPASRRWEEIYKDPQTTPDATARTVRRKRRPTHMGHIENSAYASEDGGPRLQRSVIYVRSEHGRAAHPTQKPVGIIDPLIRYSCPKGGLVADWFMGAGSVGVAALEAGRRFIGCEIDRNYFIESGRRIDEAANGFHARMAGASA